MTYTHLTPNELVIIEAYFHQETPVAFVANHFSSRETSTVMAKKPLTHDEIMCKRLSELNNNRRFNWEVIRRKMMINAIC